MSNNKGFTLVELMITLAMTGIILAAVYATYIIQKKTYTAQDQVVEMQQNIRAAMYSMIREIRMAGYDPSTKAGATITAASVSGISFTIDLNEDEDFVAAGAPPLDPNETISYGFGSSGTPLALDDADGDGVVDNALGGASLRRNSGGGLQAIADNIQAIEFLYTLEDNSTTTTPTAAQLSEIRTITLSILARSANRDAKFVNTTRYIPASGIMWDLNGAAGGTGQPTNDNFRRRLLITTVQCRNMGI